MSAEGARQQRRRRGGDVGKVPPGLFPQPGFDVEEGVGDVEPGVEQADVVTACCLKCQGEYKFVAFRARGGLTLGSQTFQKLLFYTETL